MERRQQSFECKDSLSNLDESHWLPCETEVGIIFLSLCTKRFKDQPGDCGSKNVGCAETKGWRDRAPQSFHSFEFVQRDGLVAKTHEEDGESHFVAEATSHSFLGLGSS